MPWPVQRLNQWACPVPAGEAVSKSASLHSRRWDLASFVHDGMLAGAEQGALQKGILMQQAHVPGGAGSRWQGRAHAIPSSTGLASILGMREWPPSRQHGLVLEN